MIAVVDTGGANLSSIICALERLGARAEVTLDGDRIGKAERVILPGVGAAGESMRRIAGAGLVDRLTAEPVPCVKLLRDQPDALVEFVLADIAARRNAGAGN